MRLQLSYFLWTQKLKLNCSPWVVKLLVSNSSPSHDCIHVDDQASVYAAVSLVGSPVTVRALLFFAPIIIVNSIVPKHLKFFVIWIRRRRK